MYDDEILVWLLLNQVGDVNIDLSRLLAQRVYLLLHLNVCDADCTICGGLANTGPIVWILIEETITKFALAIAVLSADVEALELATISQRVLGHERFTFAQLRDRREVSGKLRVLQSNLYLLLFFFLSLSFPIISQSIISISTFVIICIFPIILL